MAKLHFYYGVMSASKSTNLLMINYNYQINGGKCLLITHAVDNRSGKTGVIKSRLIQEPYPAQALNKINAEELMTIANKRLCNLAAKETQEIVQMMCDEVIKVCPEFEGLLVPACKYNKVCHEMYPCGKMI